MKRTALGLGVAITGGLTMTIRWLLADSRLFLENRATISAVLAALGFVALALGLVGPWLRRVRGAKPPAKQPLREVFPLANPVYWGVLLLICAALVQVVVLTPELVRVAGKSQVVASIKHRLSWNRTVAEPVEPKIRLQGLLIETQKVRTSAIINGERVQVGDEVNGSKVLSIHRRGVEMENSQGVKLLQIPEGRLDMITNITTTNAGH
jgi:hypothetical protein